MPRNIQNETEQFVVPENKEILKSINHTHRHTHQHWLKHIKGTQEPSERASDCQ